MESWDKLSLQSGSQIFNSQIAYPLIPEGALGIGLCLLSLYISCFLVSFPLGDLSKQLIWCCFCVLRSWTTSMTSWSRCSSSFPTSVWAVGWLTWWRTKPWQTLWNGLVSEALHSTAWDSMAQIWQVETKAVSQLLLGNPNSVLRETEFCYSYELYKWSTFACFDQPSLLFCLLYPRLVMEQSKFLCKAPQSPAPNSLPSVAFEISAGIALAFQANFPKG